MASNVLDSVLFRDSFGTPAMRAVFDDRELVRKYVEVEVALAKAQARCGVIPEAAAQEIAEKCNADTLDFDLLRHETEIVGYPILPLVHQISKQAGESGGYVHWGATTQDIMDTAVVLQIRDAFALIESDMDKLRAALADLARRYRDTPFGWICSNAMPSVLLRRVHVCWSVNLLAQPVRWHRWAIKGWRYKKP